MILVIENSGETVFTLDALLHALGYAARRVATARQAMAFIREYPANAPLLVVLDAWIPWADCTRMSRLLQKDAESASMRLLMYANLHQFLGGGPSYRPDGVTSPLPAPSPLKRLPERSPNRASVNIIAAIFDRLDSSKVGDSKVDLKR